MKNKPRNCSKRLRSLLERMSKRPMRCQLEPLRDRVEADFSFSDKLRVIQVVGSNGKGSVVHYLTGLLTGCGYDVVSCTSPHLNHISERIQFNNSPVDPREFEALLAAIPVEVFSGFTPFEILVYMTLLFASEKDVDFIVMEAGMGGRWDATSVLVADWTLLTAVEKEHTEFLGKTEIEIVVEKTAQIAEKSGLVAAELNPAPAEKLAELVVEKKLRFVNVKQVKPPAQLHKNIVLALYRQLFGDDDLVQARDIIENLPVLAGRREQFSFKNRRLLLDVAHTPAAIASLLEMLVNFEGEITFIYGCLQGKKYKKMINLILQEIEPSNLILTSPPSPRAVSLEDLKKTVSGEISSFENCCAAAAFALENTNPGETIVVAGSFPLTGWFRKQWVK